MHDAIRQLARQFPLLDAAETTVKFGTSCSHFANRAQWAVRDLRKEGWLEQDSVSGRGIWQLTAKARAHWHEAFIDADALRLLKSMLFIYPRAGKTAAIARTTRYG